MKAQVTRIATATALMLAVSPLMAQTETDTEQQHTPEMVREIERNVATVICSGCTPGYIRVPIEDSGTGSSQASISVNWLAGKYWTDGGQTTTIGFEAKRGHVYMVQRGARPDQEFENAPAHEECILVVDWTEGREFVSCEPYEFKQKKGAIKPPVDRSTSESTARVICSMCLLVGAGPDKKDLYSDVTLDAGEVTLGVYPWFGAIRGPGAQFSIDALPGHTYLVLWSFLNLPFSDTWDTEFEEGMLRAVLMNPTGNSGLARKAWLAECALVVDATDDWSVVTCTEAGIGKDATIYPGDRALLQKVHAEMQAGPWAQ